MVFRIAGKVTVTTIYGLRRPLRAGAFPADPELKVFGSQEEKRETDAEKGTNGVRLLRLGDYCCLGKKLHFINSFQ